MPLALPDDLSLRYSHLEPIAPVSGAVRPRGDRAHSADRQRGPADRAAGQSTARQCRCAAGELPGAQAHPWLPGCLTVSGPVEQTAAFREGRVYVQDAAAHLAVAVSGIEPGMRVLDCCAAPGGKSCRCPADAGPRYAVFLRYPPARLDLIERGAAAGHLHSGDASAGCLAARARVARRDGRRWPMPCSGSASSGKPDIAITSPRRSCLHCSAPFLRSRRNMSAPAVCCSTAPARSCAGKTRLWRRTSCARIRTSSRKRAVARGSGSRAGAMVTPLLGQHETDGFFICKFRRKPFERHQIHDAGGAGDRAESARRACLPRQTDLSLDAPRRARFFGDDGYLRSLRERLTAEYTLVRRRSRGGCSRRRTEPSNTSGA